MNLRAAYENSAFSCFRYREYSLFWVGAAFSNIGMWSLIAGRLWLMHDMTESAAKVGLVTTAGLGPVLVFSVWGGVLADRVNRLKLLRTTRGMFAVLAFVTGALISADLIEPWHLIAISLATGVLLSIDIPSRSAMVPSLVPREQLAGAVALYSMVFGGAAIVGPILLGPLTNLWGIESVFYLIGASYVFTVGALCLMAPEGHKPKAREESPVQSLLRGIQYISRRRVIAGVIGLGLVVSMFGAAFQNLMPELADKVITGGIDTYSRLLLAAGVGGLAMTGVVAAMGARARPARQLFIGGIGYGAGLLVLSQVTGFAWAAATVGAIGAFHVAFQIMSVTMLQSLADDEYRGRVMSVHMITWGSTALGAYLMGEIGERQGVAAAFGLSGAIILSCTLIVGLLLLGRRIRRTSTSVASEAGEAAPARTSG